MLGRDEFIVKSLVSLERQHRLLGPMQRVLRYLPSWLVGIWVLAVFAVGLLDRFAPSGPWGTVMKALWIVFGAILLALVGAFVVGLVRLARDPVNVERIESGLRRLAALYVRLSEIPVTDPVTGDQLVALRDGDDARTIGIVGPDGPDTGPWISYSIGEYGVSYNVEVEDGAVDIRPNQFGPRIGGTIRHFLLADEVEQLANQVERSLP